jgi:hypothetical protein
VSAPALSPEQWREWRDSGRVSDRHGHLLLTSKPGDHVFGYRPRIYVCTQPVDTPEEYRALIAVLLDALAQVGEPLFTHDDVASLRELTMGAPLAVLSDLQSLFPPADL